MFIEWRRMERTGLRRAQEAVLPLWERTRLFRAYSSWLIPGAVQTRAYTAAVLRAIAVRRDLPDDVELLLANGAVSHTLRPQPAGEFRHPPG